MSDLAVLHHVNERVLLGLQPAASVTGFVTGNTPGGINVGTWQTLVHSFANAGDLRKLRARGSAGASASANSAGSSGSSSGAPRASRHLPGQPSSLIERDSALGCYVVRFPTADPSVVRRSQRLSPQPEMRSFRYAHYLQVFSHWFLGAFVALGAVLSVATRFGAGVRALLRFPPPGFRGGPSTPEVVKSWFEFTVRSYSPADKTALTTLVGGPGALGVRVSERACVFVCGCVSGCVTGA